ncbi:DUF885 domain-containing protein [Glaciecola sp. 1036]|uniref:DUF885 domain-containing protein n=1 Tax=Alteromonadaceae TaxID=72275 RepID=UPI003D017BB5
MKTFFKWLGISVLIVLVVMGAWATHEWKAEKPFSFRIFLDRALIKQALNSPQTLTSIGVFDGIGITGHNAYLDDASEAATAQMFKDLRETKRILLQYEDLSEEQQLSKDIALYLLNTAEEFETYQYHSYPFNQQSGAQSNFPSFMDAQHPIRTTENVEHYISRLSQSNRYFTQMLEGMRIREYKKIIPPLFVIERIIDEMQGFVDTPATENILYTSLEKRMQEAVEIPESVYADYLAQTQAEIENTVYPAYEMLIEYFTELKAMAGTDDGLWRLDGGDQAYKLALRFFTTTDYSADYIHTVGLQEVDRIQAEILQILSDEGFDISQGFTVAINALAEQEGFYYPDSDEGREQILADYKRIIEEVESGLGDAFLLRPKASLDVKRIPVFKEKTAPGAYYEPPAFDGSRPGVFFANLYDIKATPTYSMRTLAYHEGIPGHHFQIAIAMELEGLPIFRTVAPFVAYIEGWALYAERVAWELGFQRDPYDNIGRLQAELFRAVRLVVDTGIHAKRWTREEAIDYMLANTGMVKSDVTSEIERYIVTPGQATAYKVGMMKILEVREKAKAALGDKFDLGEFHNVVLKNGAVPLDILEKLVDEYIEGQLATAQ